MKNTAYIAPTFRVIEFSTEGLVASSDKIEYTSSPASHEVEVLSSRRGSGIWDEE